MAPSPMSHTPQVLPIRRAVSAPRGRITTTTVILTSTSQTGLSAMVPPMSYTVITGMARSRIPLKVRGSRIPVIPSERRGAITIRTGTLILHVVNFGQSNVLYRNNGDGTFTDVTPTTGMNIPVTDAFVTFFLDVDNDADLDIFISNSGSFQAFIAGQITGSAPHDADRQVLYRNNGDGTFTDVTRESGLYHAFGAMGANFGDIDSDGYLDIYLATGAPQMGRLERDALFHNNGDGTFTDATLAFGLGNIGKGHGVTFGDVDTDGDVDIYVPVGGAFIGDQWHNLFYQNTGTGNNWLTLKLVGVKSNRDGIGAKVTLHVGGVSNPEIRYREVSGGCGFGSTNSLQLEIGLGAHAKVDTLEIVWPSGQVDTHRNLSVNRKLVITEGEGL